MHEVLLSGTVFSPEDCQRILEMYAFREFEDGLIQDNRADFSTRKSQIQFIPPEDDNLWIFERLQDVATHANNQTFNFDLDGFREGFQFAKYEIGGHYTWHCDLGHNERMLRKISMTVQLSPEESYEGGQLEFFPARFAVPRQQGMVCVFPSFMAHRVAPITKGIRYSLVSWVAGHDPFR
jgi:PKHD-type hydroxylase